VRWSNKKHKIKKHKPTASSPAEFNRFTYADNNPLSGKDIDGNRPLYSGIRTKEFYESASKSLMPQYMALLETQSQIYNAEQSTLNQFIQESITTNPFEQPMDLYIDGIRIRPGSAGYSMLLDLAMRGRTDMLGAVTIATYGGLSTNSGVVYDMGALLDIAIENYQREIIELQTAASKAQSKEELKEELGDNLLACLSCDPGEDPPGKKKKPANSSSKKEGNCLCVGGLIVHYSFGGGENYYIDEKSFNSLIAELYRSNKLDFKYAVKVPGVEGLYQIQISAYETSFANAVGFATLYFNNKGFVGYSDWWNFDWSNSRDWLAEFKTRLGSFIPGTPFWVLYGITPSPDMIPKK
jgi:hypothetical protein